MDWLALGLSVKLGILTALLLLPPAITVGRLLAYRQFFGKSLCEALLALPLVLPPTVLGYYLLLYFGKGATLGQWFQALSGHPLAFSFTGLLLASLLVNLPFAIQPMQRAFEAIPRAIREAAACCGMAPWQVLLRIELPLAWPGIVSGLVMTFAHTLGEFGVVLMVGGAIPGSTKTLSIAIYDRVQAFDNEAAATMAQFLLLLSAAAIALTYFLGQRATRRHD